MTVVNNTESMPLDDGDSRVGKHVKMDKRTLSGYWLASPPLLFLVVFFLVPSALLLIASFWTAKTFSMEPAATLANYAKALSASGFYDSLFERHA